MGRKELAETAPPKNPRFCECGKHWLHPTTSEQFHEVASLILAWSLVWMCAWLASVQIARRFLLPLLPLSSKDHENHPAYAGQKIIATVKCALVAYWCNIGLLDLWRAPVSEYGSGHILTEISGVHFTAFEIADLVLAGAHGFLDSVHVVHHFIHILMGFIIRGHCGPVLTANILMAQETSGIFLNYFLGMRNRAAGHWSVVASQGLFALSFWMWRNGIGTWGTYAYLFNPRLIPQRASFTLAPDVALASALCLASVLQWYWGVDIFLTAAGLKKSKKSAAEKSAAKEAAAKGS